ncbi:MAG: acyltransferase [Phascolarctobacterium sp.]|nr:MAG: acyltransferase [Phascolarctobacterium sp.]
MMKFIRLFSKHVMRLKNTLYRRLKIFSLWCQYGSQFKFKKFHFREGFHVFIEDKGFVQIGKNCFFNLNCSITARELIKIGNNCIFGENVKIYDHNHKYNDLSIPICEQGFSSKEIIIEDNCWIASNSIILKGVHIGANSVIGAGVIVYKDIPANSVIICRQDILKI